MPGTAPGADYRPLTYTGRLERRPADDIDLVVIHCTELPDLETARKYGERIHHEDTRTGNSGHFYIDRDGSTQCWVEPGRVAHHTRGYNERSIGIELVNLGRWPDWYHTKRQLMTEPYPTAQVEALLQLLETLATGFPNLRWVDGHEALDRDMIAASDQPGEQVSRKRDPGPMFPWKQVYAAVELSQLPPQEKK